MKVDLNEIWEFMDIAPQPKSADQGDQWIYQLVAGRVVINNLQTANIVKLKSEENYDTELLPSIFTFREILWQPNVYTQPALCIPQLNILKVFCEEWVEDIKKTQNGHAWPYFKLLLGLGAICAEALKKIQSAEKQKDIRIASILGDLRKDAFPIIKFFIFHPMNRKDYQRDALNRLNYAVKIMLTQYNNKYYELQDPYWNVTVGNPEKIKLAQAAKKPQPASLPKDAPTTQLGGTSSPQPRKASMNAKIEETETVDQKLEELQ